MSRLRGGTSRRQRREKPCQHLLFYDVDGDGDLDIVGNVEEHFAQDPVRKVKSLFSVVWFENPLK